MPMKDIHSRLLFTQCLALAATAAVDGTGVEATAGDSAAIIISLGAFAGTTPSATLKIQESDDDVDANYADVADELIEGGALPTIDTTNDNSIIKRGYMGYKRYIRVIVSAISGAGASLPIHVMVVQRPNIYHPLITG